MLGDLLLSASLAFLAMALSAFVGLSIGGAVLVGIVAFAAGLVGAGE